MSLIQSNTTHEWRQAQVRLLRDPQGLQVAPQPSLNNKEQL